MEETKEKHLVFPSIWSLSFSLLKLDSEEVKIQKKKIPFLISFKKFEIFLNILLLFITSTSLIKDSKQDFKIYNDCFIGKQKKKKKKKFNNS